MTHKQSAISVQICIFDMATFAFLFTALLHALDPLAKTGMLQDIACSYNFMQDRKYALKMLSCV
jgi:hypothetical protein